MYHRSFHDDPSSRQDPPRQHSNDLDLPFPTSTRGPYRIQADNIEHLYLCYPQSTFAPGRRPFYDYSQPGSFDRRGEMNEHGHYAQQEPNRYMFVQ